MRCIRTLASLVDFYGPYLKTIWPPTRVSKCVFLPTPKIQLYLCLYVGAADASDAVKRAQSGKYVNEDGATKAKWEEQPI